MTTPEFDFALLYGEKPRLFLWERDGVKRWCCRTTPRFHFLDVPKLMPSMAQGIGDTASLAYDDWIKRANSACRSFLQYRTWP